MRQIKYMGQRTDTKKFVYGYVFETPLTSENFKPQYFGQTNPRMCIADKDGVVFTIIPETVGQFTGAPDKYGTEIYEGNIVRIHDDDNDEVGVVVWDDSEHRWNIEQGNIVFELGSFYPRELEVVGNIHDNPELLNVQ